ncbi:MAG: sulfonate ABC transporter permease, partial [Candidatus Bathyarchaeia archaeon]
IYTSYSLSRLIIALLIAYIFGILYGIFAARSRRSESALLPILDVLQSVPILGFFPAAIFFFIAIFQESWLGIELAAIFLIFTCQAWNLSRKLLISLETKKIAKSLRRNYLIHSKEK